MSDEAKSGRPSTYSEEMVDLICEKISDGESLRAICSDEGMPNKATVFRWLALHGDFATKYARAREAQADAIFDEMLDIADDGNNDWMERKGSDDQSLGWRENGEALRRSALRVSTRQWMASKLQPKKYGERLDLNHSGSIRDLSDEDLDRRLAQLLAKEGSDSGSGGEGTAS